MALNARCTSESPECFKKCKAWPPPLEILISLVWSGPWVQCHAEPFWSLRQKKNQYVFIYIFDIVMDFLHSFGFFTYCIVTVFIFISEVLCVCSLKFSVLAKRLAGLTLPPALPGQLGFVKLLTQLVLRGSQG